MWYADLILRGGTTGWEPMDSLSEGSGGLLAGRPLFLFTTSYCAASTAAAAARAAAAPPGIPPVFFCK